MLAIAGLFCCFSRFLCLLYEFSGDTCASLSSPLRHPPPLSLRPHLVPPLLPPCQRLLRRRVCARMVARDREERCGVWKRRRRPGTRGGGGGSLFRAIAMNEEEQVLFESRAMERVDYVHDRATSACRRRPPLQYPTTNSPCFPASILRVGVTQLRSQKGEGGR